MIALSWTRTVSQAVSVRWFRKDKLTGRTDISKLRKVRYLETPILRRR